MPGIKNTLWALFFIIILFAAAHWLTGCSPPYNGEKLFHAEGCISCHRFKGNGGSMGPDLTAITEVKSDSAINGYLKNPQKYNQQARMPSFAHLSTAKRKALISFLKK